MLSSPVSHRRSIAAASTSQTVAFLILLLLGLIGFARTPSEPTHQAQRQDQHQPLATAGDLDPSFDPGIGVTTGGTVNAVAVQSDGKIVLGGSFSLYNGVARNRLARINSDGSLDSSFNPGAGANGGNPNATVNALAVQSDGKILIGGSFGSYNGVSRRNIARINSDGSLDTSFTPGSALNNTVFALAIQNDGKILAGGAFVSQNRIARFNPDGSVDGTFQTDTNSTVSAIAIQSDGKIVLGGSFTFTSTGQTYVVRLNSNGSVGTSFNPFICSTSNGGIFALAIQPDGKIVIGGRFRRNATTYILARLNSDGSFDSFAGLVPNSGFAVFAVALQSDG